MTESNIQQVTVEQAEHALQKDDVDLGDFVISTYLTPGAENGGLALSVKIDLTGKVKHFLIYRTIHKSEYFIWPWALRFMNVEHLLEYYKVNNLMRYSNMVLNSHCLVEASEFNGQMKEDFVDSFPGKVFEKLVKREGHETISEIFVQKDNKPAGVSIKVFSFFGEIIEDTIGLKPLIPKLKATHSIMFENLRHYGRKQPTSDEPLDNFSGSNSILQLLKQIFFSDILSFFLEICLVLVLGLLLFMFDFGSDTFLAVFYFQQGDYVWGSLTLFFAFLPGWMRAMYSVGKSLLQHWKKWKMSKRKISEEEMTRELVEKNSDHQDVDKVKDPFFFDLGTEVANCKVPIKNIVLFLLLVPFYILVMGPVFPILVLYQYADITRRVCQKISMKIWINKVQYSTKKMSDREVNGIIKQYYSNRTVDKTEEIQLKVALQSVNMNSEVFDKHIQKIIDRFSENATNNEQEIEKRKKNALKTKSLEAVFESFPQLLLQMYILLKSFSTRDTFTVSQSHIRTLVSICFSFLSLVKTAMDLHEYDRDKHRVTQPKHFKVYFMITSLWYFSMIFVKALAQAMITAYMQLYFLIPFILQMVANILLRYNISYQTTLYGLISLFLPCRLFKLAKEGESITLSTRKQKGLIINRFLVYHALLNSAIEITCLTFIIIRINQDRDNTQNIHMLVDTTENYLNVFHWTSVGVMALEFVVLLFEILYGRYVSKYLFGENLEIYPSQAREEDRRKTFVHKKYRNDTKITQLVQNGFFWNGKKGDIASCYFCGCSVKNWKFIPQVFVYHILKSPKCKVASDSYEKIKIKERFLNANHDLSFYEENTFERILDYSYPYIWSPERVRPFLRAGFAYSNWHDDLEKVYDYSEHVLKCYYCDVKISLRNSEVNEKSELSDKRIERKEVLIFTSKDEPVFELITHHSKLNCKWGKKMIKKYKHADGIHRSTYAGALPFETEITTMNSKFKMEDFLRAGFCFALHTRKPTCLKCGSNCNIQTGKKISPMEIHLKKSKVCSFAKRNLPEILCQNDFEIGHVFEVTETLEPSVENRLSIKKGDRVKIVKTIDSKNSKIYQNQTEIDIERNETENEQEAYDVYDFIYDIYDRLNHIRNIITGKKNKPAFYNNASVIVGDIRVELIDQAERRIGLVSNQVLKKNFLNTQFHIEDLSDRTLRGLFSVNTNIQQGCYIISNRTNIAEPELCISVFNYVQCEYKIQKVQIAVDQLGRLYSAKENILFTSQDELKEHFRYRRDIVNAPLSHECFPFYVSPGQNLCNIPDSEICMTNIGTGFNKGLWREKISISITDGDENHEYEKISKIQSRFSLNHPNIMRIYGYNPSLGKMLTETSVSTLEQFFTEKQKFCLKGSIAFIIDILNAVHFIGNLGLVHNNLTPKNIFLVENPKCVKIGNFGSASHMGVQKKYVAETDYQDLQEVGLKFKHDPQTIAESIDDQSIYDTIGHEINKGKPELLSDQESDSDVDVYEAFVPVNDRIYITRERQPYPEKAGFWKLEKVGMYINPLYCAPEVLTKGWRGMSTKSDIWSVGLTLWQIIAMGRKLFDSAKDEEELHFSLRHSPDFVMSNLPSPNQFKHCEHIPEYQVSVVNDCFKEILKCLQFDSSKRVDTFNLMKSFLEIRSKLTMFSENFQDLQLWNCEFQFLPHANLGKGNFSSVRKGEWMMKGNEVAIKTMKEKTDADAGEHSMKDNPAEEVNILKKIDHENIIKMYGFLCCDSNFSIIFELFGTTDLKKALKGGEIKKQAQLMKIIIQVARGIKYLHAKKILHLDIASRNILINTGDDLVHSKIIDFGLSLEIAGDKEEAVVGKFKKLPIGWTDPELLMSRQATLECDIWSFGILLYEIICAGKHIPKAIPSRQKEFEENYPMPVMKEIKDFSVKKNFFENLHQEFMKPCLNFNRRERPNISTLLENLENKANEKSFEVMTKIPDIEEHVDQVSHRDRDWDTIINESKLMNIIELHITKTDSKSEEPTLGPDEISKFICDVLKIRRTDCLAFDYDTGNPHKKYIQLKDVIKVNENIFYHKNHFMDHTIKVFPLRNRRTQVTFYNVPLFVPDEEITNLARTKGTPIGPVRKLKLNNKQNKGGTGAVRELYVILEDGKQFENYYWLEEPLSDNKVFRIVVSHVDQDHQCLNCLMKYPDCPTLRNKDDILCQNPVANSNMYMEWIEQTTGYQSLKKKHQVLNAKSKVPTFRDYIQKCDTKS